MLTLNLVTDCPEQNYDIYEKVCVEIVQRDWSKSAEPSMSTLILILIVVVIAVVIIVIIIIICPSVWPNVVKHSCLKM